jgi:hypothetical protein
MEGTILSGRIGRLQIAKVGIQVFCRHWGLALFFEISAATDIVSFERELLLVPGVKGRRRVP